MLKSVKASVIEALEKVARKELSEEVEACNRVFEDEKDWECPENRAEATARRALEKIEKTLWKMLDDPELKSKKLN